MYWEQTAAMRIENKTSTFQDIKRGVRQGCVLSPDLFSLYSEIIIIRTIRKRQATFLGHVMRREKLEHLVTTVKFEGKRSTGRQRGKIMDGLVTWLGPGKVSDILAAVKDRDLWRDMIAISLTSKALDDDDDDFFLSVDIILSRGNTVSVNGQVAQVTAQHEEVEDKAKKDKEIGNINSQRASQVDINTRQQILTKDKIPCSAKVPKFSEPLKYQTKDESFGPTVKRENEMDYGHEDLASVARRTIKATVRDVRKTKMFYILYLEDKVVHKDFYDETSLFLDSLNRKLYVTFHHEEDAKKACKMMHGADSNIERLEKATVADFETFPDRVSVHGFCIKNPPERHKFFNFIITRTQMRIKEFFTQDEPRSVIIIFEEEDCYDVTEICWQLMTVFEGTKIMAAPVYKTKSVRVFNLPVNVDKQLLRRYMTNSRSGGGDIESLEMRDGQAKITFKSEKHFHGVLEQKEHRLENNELKIEPYYPCLSKATFEKIASLNSGSPPQDRRSSLNNAENNAEPESDDPTEEEAFEETEHAETNDFSSGKEETMEDFDKKDLIVLGKTDVLKSLKKKHKFLKIEFDAANKKVKIRGEDSSVTKACVGLLQLLRTFKRKKILQLSKFQIKLLQTDWVIQNVNAEIGKTGKLAVLHFEENDPIIYHVQSIDVDEFEKMVCQQVIEEIRNLPDPNAKLLFTSKLGCEFLSSMSKAADGSPSGFLVTYDETKNSLLIVGPAKKTDLHKKIDAFMRDNMVDVKLVQFPYGKFQFLKKFKIHEITSVKDKARRMEIIIQESSNAFEVKGKKDEVASIEESIKKIRDSIFVDNFTVKFFGIEEYLSERDGKALTSMVESSLSCCIYLNNGSKGEKQTRPGDDPIHRQKLEPLPEPVKIATASVHGYTLHFMQGDLLGLKVEAIVNPVDESLTLTGSSNLCKAILARGKFKYPNMTVCMHMMKALKDFLEKDPVTPSDIYICDKSEEILSGLMDRCEQTFSDAYIDHIKELEKKAKPGPPPRPPRSFEPKSFRSVPTDFGHLKVKVHQGEITRWRTDAIVIAVDKSLDLKKGVLAKLILRFGGDTIQQELNNNYPNGLQIGESAQTSGGNLKCGHIFFVALPHWKGESRSFVSKVEGLIEKVLESANSNSLTAIGFPALGTGNLKYPRDVVAQAFSAAISNFAKKNPQSSLKTVDLVIYPQDTEVYDAFQSQFGGGGGSSRKKVTSDAFATEESDDDGSDDGSGGAVGFMKSAFGKVKSFLTGAADNKFKFDSVTLTVTKGDITMETCDAIVSSIKSSMDLSASGAVCKNLLKKCGSTLQNECNNQQASMQQTGVAVTSAPGLPCQNIYHVGMERFSKCWDDGVLEVLQQAAAAGVTSIALPLLGSGAKNPNMDLIKKNFLSGVKKFGKSQTSTGLKDVRLIIFSQEMYDVFLGKDQQSISPPKDIKKKFSKDIAAAKSKISDKADLKIYAKNAAHADAVKKELLKNFKTAFLTEKEQSEEIKQLNQHQVHELEYSAWELRVQIAVRLERGEAVFQSFFPKNINQVLKKLHSLLLDAVKTHHETLHKSTPTAIVWQYKNSNDRWHNFEPLMNVEIEKAYKEKSGSCDVKDSKKRDYHIDFQSMEEYEISTDGSLSKHGTKVRRFDKTKAGEPLPKRWASMGSNDNLKLVDIQIGTPEFTEVETLFRQGGATQPIKKMQRIQNKYLYQHYIVKKREMEERNGKNFQNEKRLFHGTNPNNMAAINLNGFSNNYSGAHATAYGEGTYFAVNSSYSVSYTQPDASGLRHMYLVRVLVGKTTISRQGMKFLPNQPGMSVPFDSGTDGNNVMFIIFQDAQTYPEYLISF
ncbi:poly [ADP-ribose] polymerase [Plakobranchus ocellatus]|uniref:Poly [ADP-ribose] polymerase n=1 Tax=Plakobranchus ocellatus TaxID=259542 RepID=A0AAV4AI79_9GAST|nr:poly [ADP-ribose] polymerase [Plakobranchus ocellatus]